jgi:ribosomal protein S12 methylthiotransferase
VPTPVRRARVNQLMKLQERISTERLQEMMGRVVPVLIEGLSDETDLLLQGRTQGQAPDIDGVVYVNDAPKDIGRGQIRLVEITQTGQHDLVGHVVG